MAVRDFESATSPQETRSNLTLTAVRRFVVPWADRYTYRGELCEVTGAEFLYPYAPQFGAYCSRCEVNGIGYKGQDVNGLASYEQAELVAHYGNADLGVPGLDLVNPTNGELLSERLAGGLEYVSLPIEHARWKPQTADGDPAGGIALRLNEAPRYWYHVAEYVLTRHTVTNLPVAALALTDHVNDAAMTTRRLPGVQITFPAGSLKYNRYELGRSVATGGVERVSLTMYFSFRAPGWNLFPRVGTWRSGSEPEYAKLWQTIQIRGSDNAWRDYVPFPPASFTQLWPT